MKHQTSETFNREEILAAWSRESNVVGAFRAFRSHDIEPILIKGWSVARFYPNSRERFFVDVDFCVQVKDYKKAQNLIEELARRGIRVDLHLELRKLDQVSFENLFENSQLVTLHDEKIRVLRPEDNLRVVCVHWLNDGGANKEKLRDIFYLVENRPDDFDWDRFLNVVNIKRRRWILCAIALTHKLLDLNVDETPIADEIKNPDFLPKWLMPTLEKEWNDKTRLLPLYDSLTSSRKLFQQIRKRFPPNALTASIKVGAPFDNSPRLPYQIADVIRRIIFNVPKNITRFFDPNDKNF
ncbi:MAG: nucleotidyltransferase family protein [Pyrinomonadaceae bacterium]|nr:nucleotidyltransferase family protein [Pyrinomonadaceae bacterium]